MAAIPYSLPITGAEIALGPFPFRPQGVTVVNASTKDVLVTDDRGITYPVKAATIVSFPPNPTQYLRAKLTGAGVTGDSCTVYVHNEPTPITSSGLAISGAGGASSLDVIALAAFPPASPADGDTHWLQLPSSYDPIGGLPLRWLVTYDAASALWHVAGEPLFAEILTGEAPGGGVYADFATPGPTITVPRGGTYHIEHGATIGLNSGGQDVRVSYTIGGGGSSDTDAIQGAADGTSWAIASGGRVRVKLGATLTTGTTVKLQGKGVAGSPPVSNRFLRLYPVRIS